MPGGPDDRGMAWVADTPITTSPGLTRVRWVAVVAPVRRLKMATSSVSGERQRRLRFLIDGKDAIGIDKDGKGMP